MRALGLGIPLLLVFFPLSSAQTEIRPSLGVEIDLPEELPKNSTTIGFVKVTMSWPPIPTLTPTRVHLSVCNLSPPELVATLNPQDLYFHTDLSFFWLFGGYEWQFSQLRVSVPSSAPTNSTGILKICAESDPNGVYSSARANSSVSFTITSPERQPPPPPPPPPNSTTYPSPSWSPSPASDSPSTPLGPLLAGGTAGFLALGRVLRRI